MQAVGYARTSTFLQDESIKSQQEKIRKQCNDKEWQLLKIYTDKAISGATIKKRPAFQQMMEDATNKKFDIVIFTKLDRFGRSLSDILSSSQQLQNYGVQFTSIDDQIDTSTAQGKLLFHIMGAFAEFERTVIRQRLQEGFERAKREKRIGRHRSSLPEKEIKGYFQKKLSVRSIAKIYNVSPATILNRLKEWGEK